MIDLDVERAEHHNRMGRVKDRRIGLELARQLHKGVGSGIPFIRAALRRCVHPHRALDVARAELARLVADVRAGEQRRKEIAMAVAKEHRTQAEWFEGELREAVTVDAAWVGTNFLEAKRQGVTEGGLHGWWYQVARPGIMRRNIEIRFTMTDILAVVEGPETPELVDQEEDPFGRIVEESTNGVPIHKDPEAEYPNPIEKPTPKRGPKEPDAFPVPTLEQAQREKNTARSHALARTLQADRSEYFRLEGRWGFLECQPAGETVVVEGRIPAELADRIMAEILRDYYPFSSRPAEEEG